MNCKHCGEPLAEGAKFCENCGNKIEDVTETVKATEETYKEPERVDAEVVSDNTSSTSYERTENTYSSSSASTNSEDLAKGPIGYSIASLVCGILGILCCCCGFFGFALSAAGIGLGIVSLKKNCEGRGMAIAGISCGGVGAALILFSLIASAITGNFGLGDAADVTEQLEDFLESL